MEIHVDRDGLGSSIGVVIRRRRVAVGLTQGALARQVGLQRSSISNIESGRQIPPIPVFYQLCAVLGLEPGQALPPLEDVSTRGKTWSGYVGDPEDAPSEAKSAIDLLRKRGQRNEE